jgi:hypothetical protein
MALRRLRLGSTSSGSRTVALRGSEARCNGARGRGRGVAALARPGLTRVAAWWRTGMAATA